MSYALRISHYLSEKDPAIEYFIPFTPKALVSLLDGEYGDAIGEIFSLNKEDLKELLEKSDGTLDSFLNRHNLYDLKDENGENYFVELLDNDNKGDVWIINNPEDPEENSLGDYLADAKLISDTVDTVGFLEFGRNIEGSKSVLEINEEAEDTMLFRTLFWIKKIIFSIVIAIDKFDIDRNTELPKPPKDFCGYIKKNCVIKLKNEEYNNYFSSSVVLSDEYSIDKNRCIEIVKEIERFTKFFLRLEIPNNSYSYYVASYDYICKVFEIILDKKTDLFDTELLEYIDKIHILLWKVSRKNPFLLIRLMNIGDYIYLIMEDLINYKIDLSFRWLVPKGLKFLKDVDKMFRRKWDEWKQFIKLEYEVKDYNTRIKHYSKKNGCFGIAIINDKGDFASKKYIALSSFDYKGDLYKFNNDNVNKKNKINKAIIDTIVDKLEIGNGEYCYLNNLTKRYMQVTNSKEYVTEKPGYYYLENDYYNKEIFDRVTDNPEEIFGRIYSCCERKILGHILEKNKERVDEEIIFFSRWAPCEKCRPAVFLQGKYRFYAFAESSKKKNKSYRITRYNVEKIEEEFQVYKLGKYNSKLNIDLGENQCGLFDEKKRFSYNQSNTFDVCISSSFGSTISLEQTIDVGKRGFYSNCKYIEIEINNMKGISLFCDRTLNKAFVGLKNKFLLNKKITNAYDEYIYYYGSMDVGEELKNIISQYVEKSIFTSEYVDIAGLSEVDFSKMDNKNMYNFPESYKNIQFMSFKQCKKHDESINLECLIFPKPIKVLDISMCKYGMKSLSKVNKIYFLNKSKIVLEKLIEVCIIDRLLYEIENKELPGSKIKDYIGNRIKNGVDKLNWRNGTVEGVEILFSIPQSK